MRLSPQQLANRKAGSRPSVRRVLNHDNHNPRKQVSLLELVTRVVALAQAIAEKKFYAYQIELAFRVVESLLLHDGATVTSLMARQSGKCLKKGTAVMLHSGEILPVEEISKGDLLMGPDSKPRKVLSTCNGRETMYEVKPRSGYAESFTVNESHILSVRGRRGEIENISVTDYLALSDYKKRDYYQGYKATLDFPFRKCPIDPYWLGLWLGDGKRTDTRITTADSEIRDFIFGYADKIGMGVSLYTEKDENAADSFAIVSKGQMSKNGQHRSNRLLKWLRFFDLTNEKHIPLHYFSNSKEVRQRLLAGLIDSDGYRSADKGKDAVCEITQKGKRLSWDIVRLARSLGLRASLVEHDAFCKGKNCGRVYRVCLYGALWELPIRVERKKYSPVVLRENPTTYGFDLVKKSVDDYFGFCLDGDKRFVLGDLTVTHNTEVIGSIVAAIALIFPKLAQQFPEDWRLNITDDSGVYRGFKNGVSIGIYAPRMDQSATMFDRVRKAFETRTAKRVLIELKVSLEISNGENIILSSGSNTLCQSASEQSKIEGKTHHLLIAEEAQDISDIKIRKSLSPMLSSTMGTMVMIGTATNQKCDFYTQIKNNERSQLVYGKRNHFFFPYQISIKYNSLYRRYIEKEKVKLGEDSDEFRMSYGCEWIFERGMFITPEALFSRGVAQQVGHFSVLYPNGMPSQFKYFSIVAGIDWGRSHDSTVLTMIAVDWNNPIDSGYYMGEDGQHDFTFYRKHVINWIEFIGDNYETQFWTIYEYLKQFPNLRKITMDSNTCGQAIFDRFSAAMPARVQVEPFNFSSKVKSDGYKSFYMDICGRRLTFPASVSVSGTREYRKFVQQMLDLRKEYKNGLMCVNHPDEKDAHDDYPDSIMMANYGANGPAFAANIQYQDDNFLYR